MRQLYRRKQSSRGNSYIQRKIIGFNEAARFKHYPVLTDLDNRECAPPYRNELISATLNEKMIFQIAVREVEAWLLADRENFPRFLGVSKNRFQRDPESIDNPKQYIFSMVRQSRNRRIRDGVLPSDSTARIGPLYNPLLIEFVSNSWDVSIAKEYSNSFRRFLNKLNEAHAT